MCHKGLRPIVTDALNSPECDAGVEQAYYTSTTSLYAGCFAVESLGGSTCLA